MLGRFPFNITDPNVGMGGFLTQIKGAAVKFDVGGKSLEGKLVAGDEALKPRVRIIHGHGTGALRKGLGEFLDAHPLVEKHTFESEEHGGKAITVVELQK